MTTLSTKLKHLAVRSSMAEANTRTSNWTQCSASEQARRLRAAKHWSEMIEKRRGIAARRKSRREDPSQKRKPAKAQLKNTNPVRVADMTTRALIAAYDPRSKYGSGKWK